RDHALQRWLEAADHVGVALLIEPAVQREGRVAWHLDDTSEPIERDAGLHDEPLAATAGRSLPSHLEAGERAAAVQVRQRARQPPVVVRLIGIEVLRMEQHAGR